MSTTIDGLSIERRAARFLGAALLVVSIWFAGLAAATAVAEPTRMVAVFGPAETTLRALTQGDSRLVEGGNGYIVVQGQHAGFVRHLYAGGAWLVLPVTVGGCRGRVTL
ncbi:MAG: hypothetical protein ACAH24_22840 [Hyphomicrobiaceae bacterium]|jgi:hypothetical protein